LAGANTYEDEVYTLMEAIKAVAKGTSPDKQKAQDLLDLIRKRVGHGTRPRKIKDLDALLR